MTNKFRHRQIQRIKQKYKNLAAVVAAATILSTAMLPGMPTAVAHASASSNADNLSATTSQGIGKTNQSAAEINYNSSIAPIQETKKENKIQETASKTTEKSQSESKTPEAPAKPAKEVKPSVPEEPAPVTPAPEAPAPITPAPEVPAPVTPAPEAPAPVTPAPEAPAPNDTPGSPPTDYKQVLDISATAYAPGPHDNGKWGNKTHIGSQVRPGVIAVDPNIIPLGSRVYIQYPDGHGEYAVAEDTGGAIKGHKVDIAKWTVNEAQDFGIQKVKVYVISTPEKV